ncbi:hypothetical protein H7J07_19125 [Mycobacterium koreense]|uniref:Uncharacterized protein n=1 Tax=Mycolicibacillus koreensis TaxID=1069220 RepID=A0A7I7SIW3_9MYCO|nr:hypothetical protein [Mycolicibacillus koreensis]MCV7250308.1 hypothetical protein [Mycolicibacillus koreensis]OSC33696.1 hypothetical protein B8W67_10025 [Mycolicibacillus koreensis]BBY56189.1 hypothetical protein MKOR_34400 [Mycolicibacillus koreensis]
MTTDTVTFPKVRWGRLGAKRQWVIDSAELLAGQGPDETTPAMEKAAVEQSRDIRRRVLDVVEAALDGLMPHDLLLVEKSEDDLRAIVSWVLAVVGDTLVDKSVTYVSDIDKDDEDEDSDAA